MNSPSVTLRAALTGPVSADALRFVKPSAAGGVIGKLSSKVSSRSGSGLSSAETGALSKAGQAADRGGLTKAGRALEKHGSRPGSAFPPATGNVASKNAQGQKALDRILNSNKLSAKPNRFGGKDIVDTHTGQGVRYDANGNMMRFLEP